MQLGEWREIVERLASGGIEVIVFVWNGGVAGVGLESKVVVVLVWE